MEQSKSLEKKTTLPSSPGTSKLTWLIVLFAGAIGTALGHSIAPRGQPPEHHEKTLSEEIKRTNCPHIPVYPTLEENRKEKVGRTCEEKLAEREIQNEYLKVKLGITELFCNPSTTSDAPISHQCQSVTVYVPSPNCVDETSDGPSNPYNANSTEIGIQLDQILDTHPESDAGADEDADADSEF